MSCVNDSTSPRSEMIHHSDSSAIASGRRPLPSDSFGVSWIIAVRPDPDSDFLRALPLRNEKAREAVVGGRGHGPDPLTVLASGGSAAAAEDAGVCCGPRAARLAQTRPVRAILEICAMAQSSHLTCRLPACRCPTLSAHLLEFVLRHRRRLLQHQLH